MQQDDDILKEFAEALGTVTGVEPADVTRDKTLRSDLGLDSLAMIDVAIAAEDKFAVRIPDDDLEHLLTVGDVVAYVRRARVAA